MPWTADRQCPADVGKLLSSQAAAGMLAEFAASRSVIVDLDDTLNTNRPLFDDAYDALAQLWLGFDPAGDTLEHRELCRKLNQEWIPTFGYTPKRWLLCAQMASMQIAGRPLTIAEAEQVDAKARIALGVGELRPGVTDTLTAMVSAGVPMVLLTKGEQAIQQRKIDAHQLRRYFADRTVIVDTKTQQTFEQVAADHDLNRPVSIGDSPTSDIEPAKAAGFDGILIDYGMAQWDAPDHDHTQHEHRVPSFPHAVVTMLHHLHR